MAELSFDAFYRQEYDAVVRLAFVLTGRREVAEEVAQEAFVAAYRRWHRVRGLDDPGAWVRRVAANRCVSSGRRHVTELKLLAKLRLSRHVQDAPAVPDHEIWATVRALPKRQAQVLALAFAEDRSVADIAAVLGCGEETVRTHLRRGRLEMARRLGLDEPTSNGGEIDG